MFHKTISIISSFNYLKMNDLDNQQGIQQGIQHTNFMIGDTFEVNLDILENIIRETDEDGLSIENFINIIVGVFDCDGCDYYYPDFFIYNSDPDPNPNHLDPDPNQKCDVFRLSNGNTALHRNLSLLSSYGIISKPEKKLLNKIIATEFLQKRDEPIEHLPGMLQEKIKEYRKLTKDLEKIPDYFH